MADLEGRLVYEGFEAWIEAGNGVEEKSLPHFGVECKESTREIAAWIPSEAGERFVVCYRKNEQDNCPYAARLYFDGHKIDSTIHSSRKKLLAVKKASSVGISPTEVREFMFNHVVLTDDDAYVDHASSAGIGEIKLVLQPVEVTRKHQPPLDQPSLDSKCKKLLETPKVHESSKKGLVHQVQLSECKTRPYQSMGTSSSKNVGSPTTFIFKYRSLDLLQANGIAPRPTPPAQATDDFGHGAEGSLESSEGSMPQHGTSNVKQEEEEEEEHDDDDYAIIKARELLAELEERRNQKRARKEIGQSSSKVKKEIVSPFQPGELIDLTGTDENRPKKRVKTESRSHLAHGVIDLT